MISVVLHAALFTVLALATFSVTVPADQISLSAAVSETNEVTFETLPTDQQAVSPPQDEPLVDQPVDEPVVETAIAEAPSFSPPESFRPPKPSPIAPMSPPKPQFAFWLC